MGGQSTAQMIWIDKVSLKELISAFCLVVAHQTEACVSNDLLMVQQIGGLRPFAGPVLV